MGTGALDDYADIDLRDVTPDSIRTRIERSKLFFIPTAFARMERARLNPHQLITHGLNLKKDPRRAGSAAGRMMVEPVLKGWPVTLDSCRRFIDTANSLMNEREMDLTDHSRFVPTDIVAAVFRVKDIDRMVLAAGVSAEDLSQASGVPLAIVASAIKKHRITFEHADRLRRCLLDIKARQAEPGPEFARLTDEPWSGITVDRDYQLSIETYVEVIGEQGETETRYVYSRRDVHPAPRSGHPWAIDRPADPAGYEPDAPNPPLDGNPSPDPPPGTVEKPGDTL